MKIFHHYDMPAARRYAIEEGGQALWLDSQLGAGHLLDQDYARLKRTMIELGISPAVIVGVASPLQRGLVRGAALESLMVAGAVQASEPVPVADDGEVRDA